ncbi:signal recognition particle receptor subunit beta [Folsomia candida]|uniref:Signal recognition particle receptor subunit beta n=1 Tax=Folsomia candida TaxID=158441 RepID=A0A481SX61_FOLCA|nr:signal recognition particle receptor subunit beta [Folsomia candida]QBH73243.1 putative ARL3 [Folsomia candida]
MDPKVGSPKRQQPRAPPGGDIPPPPTPSLALAPVIVAFILIFLTLVYLWTRKGRRGRAVLIVGPCEAGKTVLFSKLLGGPTVQTVTSLIPNELEYLPANGRPALVVKDLPGHDRVQIKFWDNNKPSVRGIVCVVDAAAGNKGIREAADVLYRVLTDSAVLSSCPSIFIFANKQDQPMSKGSKVIRNQLEKELTTLRMTKSATLTSTGGKDSTRILGRPDKDFDFEQISQIKIEFGEGSALADEGKIINDWLDSIA